MGLRSCRAGSVFIAEPRHLFCRASSAFRRSYRMRTSEKIFKRRRASGDHDDERGKTPSSTRICPVNQVAVDHIKPHPRNARTHSKKQIRQIADSIQAFGFAAPVLIDEQGVLLA